MAESKDKKKTTQADLDEKIKKKFDEKKAELDDLIKSMGPKKDFEKILSLVLANPPYKTTDRDIKLLYAGLFVSQITPIKLDAFDSILSKLPESDILTLFEYILLSLSYLAEGSLKVNSTILLKLHEKIVNQYGTKFILRALSAKKSILRNS